MVSSPHPGLTCKFAWALQHGGLLPPEPASAPTGQLAEWKKPVWGVSLDWLSRILVLIGWFWGMFSTVSQRVAVRLSSTLVTFPSLHLYPLVSLPKTLTQVLASGSALWGTPRRETKWPDEDQLVTMAWPRSTTWDLPLGIKVTFHQNDLSWAFPFQPLPSVLTLGWTTLLS